MSSARNFRKKWDAISAKHTAQRNAIYDRSMDGTIMRTGSFPSHKEWDEGPGPNIITPAPDHNAYADRVLSLRKQIDRDIGASREEARTFLPSRSSFGFDKGPRQAYIDRFNAHPKSQIFHAMNRKLNGMSGTVHKLTYEDDGLKESAPSTFVGEIIKILSSDQ